MPLKVGEVIKLLERDGWVLLRTTGSHRHYGHPVKPGLVTVAGRPSAPLKPDTEASILRQAGLPGCASSDGRSEGYLVVVEGDDTAGFSAFSPDLPGVVAAADSTEETLSLMREVAQVTVVDPAIA